MISSNFCPHLIFKFEDLIEFGNLNDLKYEVKGVRSRPLTCGKGGELKRFEIKLGVFNPGRLLMVRVGNLHDLK